MKKRILSFVCALCLCLTLLPATALAAGGDWTYDSAAHTLTNAGQSIILYNVTADESNQLTIGENGTIQDTAGSGQPFTGETLDLSGAITDTDGKEYTITAIGENAFNLCAELTSVELPDSLQSIGNGAFQNCASLTSIELPQSLTSVGDNPFYGCSNLQTVQVAKGNAFFFEEEGVLFYRNEGETTLVCYPRGKTDTEYTVPDDVTAIGNYAFNFCAKLTSVELPDSLQSIGDYAFYACAFTSVELPDSLQSIGDYAFLQCRQLESIKLPEGIQFIGNGAFGVCTSLTSIELPQSLTSVGGNPFYSCSNLQTVQVAEGNAFFNIENGVLFYRNGGETTLVYYPQGNPDTEYTVPDDVTVIGNYAFNSCAFTSIKLPEGLKSIGDWALSSCEELTSVTLPETLQSIGEAAFQGCRKLTSITLPDSLQSIEIGAFGYCESLTSITLPEGIQSIGDSVFCYCESLTSVTLPESLQSIGEDAFQSCRKLTSITLPESLQSIGDQAFQSCKTLSPLYMLGANPPTREKKTLENIETLNILVPASSVETYQSSEHWSAYAADIQAITSENTPVKAADISLTVPEGTVTVMAGSSITVTLENKGENPLAGIRASVTSGNDNDVIISAPNTLMAGKSATLTVTPTNTLSAGSHEISISVTADNLTSEDASQDASVTGELSFTLIYPVDGTGSTTTETTTNPDGSTTTTVTNKVTGTVTETTKFPDGSKEVVETKKDGTVTTTTTDTTGNKTQTVANPDGSSKTTVDNKDGSGSVTLVDENGNVISSATLSQTAVEAAQAKGEAVTLPMPEVPVTADREAAPTVTVNLPADTAAKVEIPVENVTPGTVAVLVKDDGTEEVIKTSLTTDSGVAVTLSNGDTVKIVDNSQTFADVPDSYWGKAFIDFATSRGLFAGTSQTTFAPDAAMTRGMIVTVLASYDGVDTASGSTWYEAGRLWAVANGISDGTNMDGTLTREQLATMLWRYAQDKGYDTTQGGMAIREYADFDQISDYAVEAMTWAVNAGLISGTSSDTLSPQGSATRAQVATILMRFVENSIR